VPIDAMALQSAEFRRDCGVGPTLGVSAADQSVEIVVVDPRPPFRQSQPRCGRVDLLDRQAELLGAPAGASPPIVALQQSLVAGRQQPSPGPAATKELRAALHSDYGVAAAKPSRDLRGRDPLGPPAPQACLVRPGPDLPRLNAFCAHVSSCSLKYLSSAARSMISTIRS